MMNAMAEYRGILFIGDPHMSGVVPGFRRDDYPRVALKKLRFCLGYAADHELLPAILGDLFNVPRDNANWVLGELIEMLSRRPVVGIYGNHDAYESSLSENDSMDVLWRAKAITLLTAERPWVGSIGGRPVVLGGSSWGMRIPEKYERPTEQTLVFWMTHHDLQVPGYDEGRMRTRSIPGVDLVINGHIHRSLEDVKSEGTVWLTPGNISRISRSDLTRGHVPGAMAIRVKPSGWERERVVVPHEPFEEVFYPLTDRPDVEAQSGFVTGLAELQARRTSGGEGLQEFLGRNLGRLEPEVQDEIRTLMQETLSHGEE